MAHLVHIETNKNMPFRLGSNIFKCCTIVLNYLGDTNAWCLTMVDDLGEYVGGQSK